MGFEERASSAHRMRNVAALAFAGTGFLTALAIIVVLGHAGATDIAAIALLALAATLPIVCCFRSLGWSGDVRFDPLEPGVIVAAWFYLNVLIPAIWSYGALHFSVNWSDPVSPPASPWFLALGASVWSIVFFGIGYRGAFPTLHAPPRAPKAPPATSLGWTVADWGVVAVMLVVGATFRLQRYRAYGFANPIELLSPSLRAAILPEISNTAVTVESLFDWSVLLLVFHAIVTRRRIGWAGVALALAAMASFLTTGKRSSVLVYAIPPVIWYHYLRHHISVTRAAALGTLGVFVLIVGLLLPRMLVVPLLNTNRSLFDRTVSYMVEYPVSTYLNSQDLSTWDMTVTAVTQRDDILHDWGGARATFLKANLEGFAYVVPRPLWPGKPAPVELGQHFFQRFMGGTRDNAGFTVGVVGAWFLIGGLPGLGLAMFLLGFAQRLVYVWLRPWESRATQVGVYSIIMLGFFLFVRFGTLSYAVLNFAVYYLPGLAAILVLQRKRVAVATNALGTVSSNPEATR